MPPLGLQYIASNINNNEHKVVILDQSINYDRAVAIDKDKKHVARLLSNEILFKYLKVSSIDIVGISCNFSYQHAFLVQLLKEIKNYNPKIKTVIGGNHVTAYYQNKYDALEGVDAVILGEGEEAFNDYLEGTLVQDKFHRVENIDKLKFPLRKGGMQPYFDANLQHFGMNTPGAKVIVMISSRGCLYNCCFCSVHNIWGKGIRYRSPENVLAEIEEIIADYKATEIHFEDDNLLANKDRCLKIFKGMEKYNIKWACPNGVDLSKLDDEVLEAMKASGCYQIIICPESVTPRILKFYRKPFSFETIKEKVTLIKKHGIKLTGYFIVGAPDETFEEMENTVQFGLDNFDDLSLSCLAPYIGTDLFDYCNNNNLFHEGKDYGYRNNNFLNLQADVIDTFKRKTTNEDIGKIFNKYQLGKISKWKAKNNAN